MINEVTKRMLENSGFERTFRGLRSDIARLAARYRTSQALHGRKQRPDMVFVWIPKTAGTSVYEALQKSCGMTKLKTVQSSFSFPQRGPVTFGHMSYNDLIAIGAVQRDYSQKAYKFSFVRCPYERAVSLYNYLKRGTKVDSAKSFIEFLEDVHLKRPAIGLYNTSGLSQTNPQVDWLIGRDGEFLTDQIFKLDDIGQFSDEMNIRFGITLEIEKMNVSRKQITIHDIMHKKEILEKIEEIYSRDFDLLGYTKISRSRE